MTELHDIQNLSDDRQIPLDRVGIKGLRFPAEIRDQSGSQQTVASATLTVDLPAHLKGTHMSRFVEALQESGCVLDVNSVFTLPLDLLTRLGASRAQVDFVFPFFRTKQAPVTGKVGLVDYEVRFTTKIDHSGATDFQLTVSVPVSTLCPCSKAISARGAHNQRGIINFSIRSKAPVWIEELIAISEASASCELYSLLKRPDEKAVTERAYDNPVFVEDLVRNVAAQALAHSSISWFRVEVENFESIHNHNAYAVVECTK